jgi:copper chaperone NosL
LNFVAGKEPFEMRRLSIAFMIALTVVPSLFLGCAKPGPVLINYGEDECDHCKMTIADQKFGSEMVTTKGKVYKFDSIECLAAYYFTTALSPDEIHSGWVTDFSHPGSFLNVSSCVIIASERQKSPMGMGLVAVGTAQEAASLIEVVGGKTLPWDGVVRLVATDWKLSK